MDIQEIPKIKVIIRKRPLSKKEITKNDTDIIEIKSLQTLIVKELKTKVDMTKYVEEHQFTFDTVYGEESTNEQIYIDSVRPMINLVFKSNAKITCFAYGQTGSGKTHTMMGPSPSGNGQISCPGLYLLSGFDLFSYINSHEYRHLNVFISFYEIYCGKLYDLLNERNQLIAREDGKGNIIINSLQERQVLSLNDLMKLIDSGLKMRTVGVTGANSDSSRSHGIIQILIKNGNTGKVHGKLSFIDLAGSERAQDTVDTNKQTRIDGAEINKSLLALKECIRAMDQGKSHTPFRGSKLTLVLRDSFIGGNCKTLMIANVSPSSVSAENTLNTLRYADRVKELKKEKSDSIKNDYGLLMMMPRNHNNSFKYNMDKEKDSNKDKDYSMVYRKTDDNHKPDSIYNAFNTLYSLNNHNENKENSHSLNIKQTQTIQNKIGSQSVRSNMIIDKEKEDQNRNRKNNNTFVCNQIGIKSINLQRQSINTKQSSSNNMSMDFINSYNYYNKSNDTVKPTNFQSESNKNRIKEEINRLSTKHDSLLEEIIKSEDLILNLNREYVDGMVNSIKLHMQNVSNNEEVNSNLNQFVENGSRLVDDEIKRANQLKNEFSHLKVLIQQEEEIKKEIFRLEMICGENEERNDDVNMSLCGDGIVDCNDEDGDREYYFCDN